MTDFTRPLTGYRFVDTRYGDTLQVIAARELGDASRWTDLIAYNNLVPPFITDDPALAGAGVILTGQSILVPAPAPIISSTSDPAEIYGKDVQLGQAGELLTDGSDFTVVSGIENLKQALSCRISSDLGDLMWHKNYGCDARRLIGKVNGPTKSLLGAQVAKSAVAMDPRISRVTSASAFVDSDAIPVTVDAETIAGQSVQASTSL